MNGDEPCYYIRTGDAERHHAIEEFHARRRREIQAREAKPVIAWDDIIDVADELIADYGELMHLDVECAEYYRQSMAVAMLKRSYFMAMRDLQGATEIPPGIVALHRLCWPDKASTVAAQRCSTNTR